MLGPIVLTPDGRGYVFLGRMTGIAVDDLSGLPDADTIARDAGLSFTGTLWGASALMDAGTTVTLGVWASDDAAREAVEEWLNSVVDLMARNDDPWLSSAVASSPPGASGVTVAAQRRLLWEAREALRLTREYVWPAVQLPCVEGWSWWDACRKIDDLLGVSSDDLYALGASAGGVDQAPAAGDNEQVPQVTTADLFPESEASRLARFTEGGAPTTRMISEGIRPANEWPQPDDTTPMPAPE